MASRTAQNPEPVRLIEYFRGRGLSNREARRLLETGKVYLGPAPTADPTRDVDPAMVAIRENAPRVRVGRDAVVLERDRHLAVVLKPAGMLSVPAPGRRDAPVVLREVGRALGSVFPVHRLDEETSGLMLVARSESCQQALKQMLFEHRVERGYLALVRGRFPSEPQTVRTVLVRDRGDGLRGSGRTDSPDGKPAVTELRLVEAVGPTASLVEARLETGRTHQVRIHLAEMGHAVLGDRIYGTRGELGAPRLALHAAKLELVHPITGAKLAFELPLPDDLERLRRDLSGARPRRSHRRRR